MKKKFAIQKWIAAMLLMVFSISIAPKAYFHDLVAHHKDISNCKQLHQSSVLHKQSFNCHFDDLVVTTPFTLQAEQPVIFSIQERDTKTVSFSSSFLQQYFQHKENRGPPAA